MSERLKEHRASRVESGERTPPGHADNLDGSIVRKAIDILAPSGKPADILKLFEHRTSIEVIRSWRVGRRYIPQWARDIIRSKIDQLDAAERNMPRGPGKEKSRLNLRPGAYWHR